MTKEIVEQLLPFSRRETDSTAYGPVNLEAVLRDATKMVSIILPSNIQLKKEFKDTHVNVFGRATQLHQVLLNLCSNAVQAMEGKGGVLTVQAEKINADVLFGREASGEAAENYKIAEQQKAEGVSVHLRLLCLVL